MIARGRRRGLEFGSLLLLYNLWQFGVERIPPVTLITIAINSFIYLQGTSYLSDVCISCSSFWSPGGYWRVLASSFHHASDMHLYYNMISFLYKGQYLEKRLRSEYFAYLIGVFAVTEGLLYLALNTLFAYNIHPSYYHDCAIGFSGVIFALKVVSTKMWPNNTDYLLGFIPVKAKYACWAELLLIQILMPDVSLVGHLAGIIVGYAYTMGPLKNLMGIAWPPDMRTHRPAYTYMSGTASTTKLNANVKYDEYYAYSTQQENDEEPSTSRAYRRHGYKHEPARPFNTDGMYFTRENLNSGSRYTTTETNEVKPDTTASMVPPAEEVLPTAPPMENCDRPASLTTPPADNDMDEMRNRWQNYKLKKRFKR